MRISAVVLAAGESRRMGRPKQILPFRGRTVIECIVGSIASSGIDECVVVLGHAAGQVAAVLAPYPLSTVINTDYKEGGMLSSVVCGIRNLSSDADVACIVPGDQPLVTAGIIAILSDACRPGGKGIVIPTFRRKRGHPVMVGLSAYRHEIECLPPSGGLRGLMSRHPDDVLEVDVDDESILLDIDEPSDYEELLSRCD